MVTVGYGDITGTNPLEVFISNIIMFIACGVFGFSINSLGYLLKKINKSADERKKN